MGREALTVGLIGAGQAGQRHAQAFARLGESVRIVGVADADEARAQALASACKAQAFTDYRALLEKRPEAVLISLPHHLHREAGLAAAEAGAHILMEKPLAHTLDDARALVEACREHRVRLAVGFVHRYRMEFQEAHRLIAAGEIGAVTAVVDVFGLSGGTHVPGWVWERRLSGGGILLYSGIHSVDWQRWLVGSEVVEVFCRVATFTVGPDVEDSLVGTLSFASGALGALVGNQPGYPVEPRTRLTEIYGTQGCIRLRVGERLDLCREDRAYHLEVGRDDPFVAQACEFVAAVREGRDPWISGEDGLRAQEICEAMYRSARENRLVALGASGGGR
ncbi:MAG: Gfo/Idh/MocA family protein [Anaerolineae bacterium]